MLVFERDIYDDDSGALLASIEHRTVCRGDGGFAHAPAARSGRSASPSAMPDLERPPDEIVDIVSLPQAALIYRLSADLNPLHADPEVARAAGFLRPILHGLCTYGIAARAIIGLRGGKDPNALKSLGMRFLAPVYPGELIRTEIWKQGDSQHFRCLLPDS